jgi:hypothetical protein
MNIQITLKTTDHWDVESRLNEVTAIREWIEELVEWNQDLYQIRFHSSGHRMIVWFEHDKHAMLFKLRWS